MRWMVGTMLILAGCQDATPVEFDGNAALGYVQTQLSFGPRVSGSEASRLMGNWLDSLLRERADTVVVQEWTHETRSGETITLRNFVARFVPEASQRILLLAHWDTRPVADGPNSQDTTKAVPGANDGASGVAVLLGIADALYTIPPGIGVDLLFVDGEDYGSWGVDRSDVLIGSTYYAANPVASAQPLMAILLDMVGDRDLQIYKEGNSVIGAPEVADLVWRVARERGYGHIFMDTPKYTLDDDHIPLQRAGFRAIDIIDFDYPAWHTPDDTIDQVSAQSLQIVGDVTLAVIRQTGSS